MTGETADFKVEVEGTVATWFYRAIAKGGKRLTWIPIPKTGRWDSRHGLWSIPCAIRPSQLEDLERSLRAGEVRT